MIYQIQKVLPRRHSLILAASLVLLVSALIGSAQYHRYPSQEGIEMFESIPDSAVIKLWPTAPFDGRDYDILVFTDPRCPHCRNFHLELQDYIGDELLVAYFPTPLDGINSPNADKLFTHWCGRDNRLWAINKAFAQGEIDDTRSNCPVSRLALYHWVNVELDLRGTPSIGFRDGAVLTGIVPISEILGYLSFAKKQNK